MDVFDLDAGVPRRPIIPLLYKIARWTLVAFVVFSTLFFAWAHAFSTIRWNEDYEQAGCARRNSCFCERINNDSFCRQRSNAWSSLSFSFVGAWMLYDYTKHLTGNGKDSIQLLNMGMMAIISIILGTGSYLYHATLTLLGERADGLGMHFIGLYLAVFSIVRLFKAIADVYKFKMNLHLNFALVFYPLFILVTIANILKARWGKLTWIIMGGEIAVVFVAEAITSYIRQKRPSDYYLLAATAFVASYIMWNLDVHDIICYPTSLFQGHAIWHIGLAVSVWSLYSLYSNDE
ncbi:hypothetical protein GEMRC1_000925 [Eukaryota sp. GEM-RC1]